MTERRFVTPDVERALWGRGLRLVAGVDEVGMGPLAGPVVAAAVVFRDGPLPDGVDDSKRLTERARERAAVAIRACAAGIGIGVVGPEEVDRLNVYHAGLRAMRLAVDGLPEAPEHVLVDGRVILPELAMPQQRYVGGDALVYSIAAASIIAKVHRDALMRALDSVYPEYGFRRHVGYATREHLQVLQRLGPTPIHRRSFAPCAAAMRP